jgi:hypothetical protein
MRAKIGSGSAATAGAATIAGRLAAPARRARRFKSVDMSSSPSWLSTKPGGKPPVFLLGVMAVIRAVLEPVRVARAGSVSHHWVGPLVGCARLRQNVNENYWLEYGLVR